MPGDIVFNDCVRSRVQERTEIGQLHEPLVVLEHVVRLRTKNCNFCFCSHNSEVLMLNICDLSVQFIKNERISVGKPGRHRDTESLKFFFSVSACLCGFSYFKEKFYVERTVYHGGNYAW